MRALTHYNLMLNAPIKSNQYIYSTTEIFSNIQLHINLLRLLKSNVIFMRNRQNALSLKLATKR